MKSAYLYNLLRRTTWPDSTFENEDSPYRVTVLGHDNLEGLLTKIAERKKVNKRSIKLEKISSMKDYRPCHMLYVPGDLSQEQQEAVLKKTAGTPCLVVGDTLGFARAGAMANFVNRDDGTLGIELNLAQAKKRKLRFDPQLLDVAQVLSE
ncbi:MAG: YfiR family protein [Pirellulales bacterium]|nr:YfiR family protein [Pirellulales bacterium]